MGTLPFPQPANSQKVTQKSPKPVKTYYNDQPKPTKVYSKMPTKLITNPNQAYKISTKKHLTQLKKAQQIKYQPQP